MSSDPDLSAALTRMRAAGVTLAVRDGNLAVQTRRPLTAAQAGFLRANKTALIALLARETEAPLPPETHEAMEESIAERAAIREFDGGEPRAVAEREARAAMRVYQYRITDKPASWLTLIAPGCDLDEARRIITNRFGAARVLDVVPHRASGLRARSPGEQPGSTE